jgi:hypothetical protein
MRENIGLNRQMHATLVEDDEGLDRIAGNVDAVEMEAGVGVAIADRMRIRGYLPIIVGVLVNVVLAGILVAEIALKLTGKVKRRSAFAAKSTDIQRLTSGNRD